MLRGVRWAAIAGVCVALCAQDLPPGVLLLSQVKRHTAGELKQLNNVSCLETVYREQQTRKGKMMPLDTVRLEVLTDGHAEQYASPGDRKFSSEHPITYAGSGVLGNGFFGLYLRSIVLSGFALTQYKGEEENGGRRLARWNYRLSAAWSREKINLLEGSGTVGFHGSFWADPETYDVARLELHADEIPSTLPIKESGASIEFERTRLGGGADVLLPQSAEYLLIKTSGEIDHNRLEFTHCRVFGAESSIDFRATGADAPTPQFGASTVDDTLRPLPAGLQIEVKLTNPISGDMPVGSLIEGAVAAKVKGAATIAEGSPVRGRIRRMEHYSNPMPYFVVALEFTELESEGIRYRFYADAVEIDTGQGARRAMETPERIEALDLGFGGFSFKSTKTTFHFTDLPGVATFFVNGTALKLQPGFRTVWKTKKLEPEEKR